MSKLTANLGYVDSLSSKKQRQMNKESLPKEIQHKLKLIEKAFCWQAVIQNVNMCTFQISIHTRVDTNEKIFSRISNSERNSLLSPTKIGLCELDVKFVYFVLASLLYHVFELIFVGVLLKVADYLFNPFHDVMPQQ
jgi:hypothetical protein